MSVLTVFYLGLLISVALLSALFIARAALFKIMMPRAVRGVVIYHAVFLALFLCSSALFVLTVTGRATQSYQYDALLIFILLVIVLLGLIQVARMGPEKMGPEKMGPEKMGLEKMGLERKQFLALEQQQLQHDHLTRLPNYAGFLNYTGRILKNTQDHNNGTPAVFVVVISGLHEIDQHLGFGVEEAMTKEIAKRLLISLRRGDYIARLSSDTFGVFVHDVTSKGHLYTIGQNVIDAMRPPLKIKRHVTRMVTHVGVAWSFGHLCDANDLIRKAHKAAVDAVSRGMEVIISDQQGIEQAAEQQQMFSILQEVLTKDLIEIHYQPQIDLQNSEVVGVEALFRLPKDYDVPFGESQLIALAEQCGLIHELHEAVFDRVFTQLVAWQAQAIRLPIAVNLSTYGLRNRSLLQSLLTQVKARPEWGKRLKIEITETASLDKLDEAADFMRALHDIGVLFSIDDFGTRYSSIEYLQRLPVQEVKIDKSFVLSMLFDENSAMIVRSTIQLAHELDLKVTAEGVEDKETLELLKDWGCDIAQGFYFAKPMDADALSTFVSTRV